MHKDEPPASPQTASGGLLVCGATAAELDCWPAGAAAERLVSGVGIPQTLEILLLRLGGGAPDRPRPALLVNLGIAGAYPGAAINIGDIVIGGSEVYGDIGFELPEPPGFRPVAAAAFGAAYAEPYPLIVPDWLVTVVAAATSAGAAGGEEAPVVPPYRIHVGRRGVTVNACTGTDATGLLRARLFEAHFETMEGAAVARAGALFGVPVCEIRAISNLAGRRDMRPENIRRALDSLAHYLRAAGPRGTPSV